MSTNLYVHPELVLVERNCQFFVHVQLVVIHHALLGIVILYGSGNIWKLE